jgi:hypothetical protein
MIRTITETTTIETKQHKDGFEYTVHRYTSNAGPDDSWASIPNARSGGCMRKSDAAVFKAKVNGKYYRFDGDELVCVGADPQIVEMRKRVRLLIEKLMSERTHVFCITCACYECDARTILFCEKHGVVDIGCEEAYDIVGEFATINNTGRIIGACDASDDRTVQRIINEYQDTFCEIEEWINASVS